MQLSNHIDALLADLATAGSLGDENVAQAAERLSEALKGSARFRLLDLLSEVALEVNGQLPSGHVDIRLAGQDRRSCTSRSRRRKSRSPRTTAWRRASRSGCPSR